VGDNSVAVVSELAAKVIAEIERLSKVSNVVVLSTPTLTLSAEKRWQLLRGGAADVLDWADNNTLAERIAALP
jgi:hypothetical protein